MMMLAFAVATAHPLPKAHGIMVYNFPDSDSCATWTDKHRGQYHDPHLTGWVLGFVSGLNAYGLNSGNIAPSTNASGLIGWIDNYCAANPLDSVTTASFKLAEELKSRSAR